MAAGRQQQFKEGHIVRVMASFNHEPVGVRGYIYGSKVWDNVIDGRHYGDTVFYVITENGVDLGGFNGADYKYLEFDRDSGILYPDGVDGRVEDDFAAGWFDLVF